MIRNYAWAAYLSNGSVFYRMHLQDECAKARFDALQRNTVSYLNAHHSEVSTGALTDACMVSVKNPWTGELHAPHSSQNSAIGTAVSGGATGDVGTAVSSNSEVCILCELEQLQRKLVSQQVQRPHLTRPDPRTTTQWNL